MGTIFVISLIAVSGRMDALESQHRLPGEEFVINGRFEMLNEQGFPDAFHMSRFTGEAEVIPDESVYRSSGRSVRVGGDGRSRVAVSTGRLDVVGGETYVFKVWYRSNDPVTNDELSSHVVARLQAWSMSHDGESEKVLWDGEKTSTPQTTLFEIVGKENLHLFPAEEGESGEWYALEAIFELPESTDTLQINLFNWFGKEAIWYDDVSLLRLPDVNIDWTRE